MSEERIFLFSIDLEDVRLWMPDGLKYRERVPANTYAYLNWLKKYNAYCTFFVVGEVAEKYPSLIKEIASAGHEIACHSNRHITLNKQSAGEFRKDISQNLDSLYKAGASDIKGFRAPVFSLTGQTNWAHDVLHELGFIYSSSVLPAKNPLFGWPEFGPAPKKLSSGLYEIPMTVGKAGPLTVPYGGGTYFRLLPSFMIRSKAKRHRQPTQPLLGYFHPYDIDTEQEHFMHPGINNSLLFNKMMYINRSSVFKKLDMLMAMGFKITTCKEYISTYLSN